MNKKEILDAFHFRHACKVFDPDRKIPEEDFNFILETARLSPSSFGFEPWHFLIIQNRDILTKFLSCVWGGQRQFPTASHVIFALVKRGYFMRYDSDYIMKMMRDVHKLPEDVIEQRSGFVKNFQENDYDLLSSDRALDDWAARQTYIPLANMMTAAALIGIDTCPIEGFDRKKVNALLASEFNVDLEKYTMGYALAFGYRDKEPHPKTRQSMDEITTWIK